VSLSVLQEHIHPDSRPKICAQQYGGIPALTASLSGPFRAVFTTRTGGVSKGPFQHLNLSQSHGDDPGDVKDNRRRLARAVREADGLSGATGLVSPRQVHGLRVIGTAEYKRGPAGAPCDGLTVHPERDAGLGALLVFGDCVPVIMVGEVDAALVHGGWRGLLGGVVQEGARAMTAPPGLAFIGPSAGPCCYKVDSHLVQSFADRYGRGLTRGGHLDLWEVCTRALEEVGVPRSQVVNPRLCTICNPELFYSHRRDGPATGRQGALLWAVS